MSEAEILFEVDSGVAVATLNRPAAMNALTLSMIETLHVKLQDWAQDESVAAVVIRGAGERAFCAGGDIRALYDAHFEGGDLTETFFRAEYRLNHLVYHYAKPYIALMDGVVMGGGVGVSVHGRYRVVGDNTLFAMPETGIGLFPDVGASFFLPRMPGALGLFLGLTGSRLRAADCLYVGIGDCYVPTDRQDALIDALRQNTGAADKVQDVLDRFSQPAEPPPLAERRDLIDQCFTAGSAQAIETALERTGGEAALKMLETLRRKSPIGLMVGHRQLRAGAALEFDDCMVMEFRLSQRVMADHDFYEGVRALIIDKDNAPDWRPGALADITPAMVDAYFAPAPTGDLTF
ncbi:MAG: enoyl-CoA hydratase/isomerase family protein [Alphaproteobacteria bacterium]|jgi:enoyl-CoA hydratase